MAGVRAEEPRTSCLPMGVFFSDRDPFLLLLNYSVLRGLSTFVHVCPHAPKIKRTLKGFV